MDRKKRVDAVQRALGEASYEGNLGVMEVFQFYKKASEQEIAEFEAVMSSGDEEAGWDIVQGFTGVDLVGLGSEPSVAEMHEMICEEIEMYQWDSKIKSYVDGHYDKRKMTFQSLIEMVEQTMLSEALSADDFLELLKSNGYEAAEFIKSVGGRVQITNLGSKQQRKAIQNLLQTKGIEFDAENYKRIAIGDQVFDFVQGDPEGGGHDSGDTAACAVMDATAFEGNIIYGLIYLQKGEKSAKAFLDTAMGEKKGIVCDPETLKQGVAVAKTLQGPMKSAGLNIADVVQTSSGKVDATLTETYLEHGVTREEAKADIAVDGIGLSVKKAGPSQFISAQGPELAAIYDVAMANIAPELSDQVMDSIKSFTDGLQRAVGSETKAHAPNPKTGEMEVGQAAFEPARAKLAKKAKTKAGKEYVDETPYQKLVSRHLNLMGDSLSDEEKEELKSAFAGTTAENFMELREGVSDILENPKLRSALCKEGFSGEYKFGADIAKAHGLVKWDNESPKNSQFVMVRKGDSWDEEFFDSLASKAKLEVRSRGGTRGGAFRASVTKEDLSESADSLLEMNFSEEEQLEVNKHADMIYNSMVSDDGVLSEGILDTIGGAIKQGWEWTKEKAKAFAASVSKFIASVTQWFKGLLGKGFSYVMDFLGFVPVSLEA